MLRLAVLASGRGSNLQALHKAIAQGRLHARIVLVLSDKPAAPALEAARASGLPTWSEPFKKFPDRAAFDAAMLAAMHKAGVEGVALAGYMRLLSRPFLQAFAGKILNIHPSLLPAFPGAQGAADTLDYGAKFAGCTVHIVEEAVDMGPVVIQAAVPVRGNANLASLMPRIHALEHRIFPQALQWLAAGRLRLRGRMVQLLPPREEAAHGQAEEQPDNGFAMGAFINPPLEAGF
jgi:phosphoribosylglycinamide formyltransferase-1